MCKFFKGQLNINTEVRKNKNKKPTKNKATEKAITSFRTG